ncbi:hypothetical protein FZEAL_4578 [Fusarium zealandicum]|uniref:Uncharacterized protein n=1 Tax=Fusarium zealandicum TaxID=1053134 RepID=A0A8H4XLR0_9HYPO|nr:hypothetical protein FZEAL_4578 [Fusarium zealandicum]
MERNSLRDLTRRGSRRLGHYAGRSMDITASTINRSSPLDLDLVILQSGNNFGQTLGSVDTSGPIRDDAYAARQALRSGSPTPDALSNAAIIESYADGWNSRDPHNDLFHPEEGFDHNESTVNSTPRWPFINDDVIVLPDPIDEEPLFPARRDSRSQPRRSYRIDDRLQDPASSCHRPLDPVFECEDVGAPIPPRGKVMTSAQFDAYLEAQRRSNRLEGTPQTQDSDEEKAEYEEDDFEAAERFRKQRRQQEAHIINYRQQMMKTTNGPSPLSSANFPEISMAFSQGAPLDLAFGGPVDEEPDEDDEEDDVPLALLEAYRLSGGKRLPTRMASVKSNTNLHVNAQEHFTGPGPTHGKAPSQSGRPIPAFARGLPHDPFAAKASANWAGNTQQPLHPGGLVGIIASEERSKALRRGTPASGFQNPQNPSLDANWAGGTYQLGQTVPTFVVPGMQPRIPQYGPQAPGLGPQVPGLGTQAQTQQMSHFLQAQMEFMQTFSSMNQQRNQYPGSVFSSNRSVMNAGFGSGASTYAMSTHGPNMGYAASVAPSERSNVGLPSRYKTVSRVPSQTGSEKHLQNKDTPTARIELSNALFTGHDLGLEDSSDEDEEEFWRAKCRKQDKRRAVWMGSRDLGIDPAWIT